MKSILNKKNSQNILITGISGYLGTHIAKTLLVMGYNVIGLKRISSKFTHMHDIIFKQIKMYNIEESGIEQAFKENEIQAVMHCATVYGRKNESISDIETTNITFPLEVLKVGKKYKLKYFINTHTLLNKNANAYSESKFKFLEILESESVNLMCINLALEHFYGPMEDSTKFISWIIKNCLDEVESIPLTFGEQKRDFIYIDDVVDAFVHILKWCESNFSCDIFHFEIGTGKTTTIRDAVELIYELSDAKKTKLEFGKVKYRLNEKMNFEVNLETIRKIGWVSKVTLKQGLEETIRIEKLNRKIFL